HPPQEGDVRAVFSTRVDESPDSNPGQRESHSGRQTSIAGSHSSHDERPLLELIEHVLDRFKPFGQPSGVPLLVEEVLKIEEYGRPGSRCYLYPDCFEVYAHAHARYICRKPSG